MAQQPILVAGGGIGGLTTALGLAQEGFDVTVLERAAVLSELGAGIQLGPNAFRAFDRLGVGDRTRAMAIYVDHLRLMDAMTAEDIAVINVMGPFRERFGNPYAVVHRGELHGIFVRACQDNPRITLRTGCGVTGYEQDGTTATALLESGERVTGSILIGADGLWSRIRGQMLTEGPPRVSGHTSYRSVIPTEQMPEDLRWNAATLWAGPKCHLVHYPLSGWKQFNLVVTFHNDAPEPVAGKSVVKEDVLKGFAHIHPKAQEIILHGNDWKMWVLCDRDPVENWIDGRVALLGDAAHPTLQYLAQGACMAMEDAVCLAEEMSAHRGNPEAALGAYQDRRVLRTARVQLQSRAAGDHIYHPKGAHAALRNAIMSSKSDEEWFDVFEWLYGADATARPMAAAA